jgi:DNA-binding GntR family transcriptional regulator
MDRLERIIFLSTRIKELRSEQERLTEELGQLVDRGSATNTKPHPRRATRDGVVSGSLADRVLKVVQVQPSHTYTVPKLAEAIGVSTRALRGTVARLKAKKLLVRASRGRYRGRSIEQ